MIGVILSGLAGIIGTVVDKAVPDKDEANKLKADLLKQVNDYTSDVMKAQRDVIIAEASGQSAAQRNWRPHLMYFLMSLIGFNVIVVPMVNVAFGVTIPVIDAWSSITDQAWTLLQIGMGGYIVGRSAEKIATTIKG